ncbi:MAG: ABC transporter ATP-binding protein/permease [Cyanobacteria bacterium P01_D01_bin.156]
MSQPSSLKSVILPYWLSREKLGAWSLLVVLIGLLLIQTGLKVVFLIYGGEVTSALAAQDADRFWQAIGIFLIILLVGIPLASLSGYVRAKLGLFWRTWLTHHYLDHYLSNNHFYQIRLRQVLANPDQRIEEDVRTLTQESLKFLVILLESGFQLIGFAGVLWSISQPLVAVLVVYAVVGTAIATLSFGKSLISINAEQLQQEATFRYDLARIRENTEAIALYRGEKQELSQSWQQFGLVLRNFSRLIRWQLGLNLFQNHYRYGTFIIPGIILAPRLFAGDLEIGDVTQAGAAFNLMLGALALIVIQLQQLTNLGASIQRLTQLTATFTDLSKPLSTPLDSQEFSIKRYSGSNLSIEHLTLSTPNSDKTLIQDLSFTLPPKKSLLIVGPSGIGKSSLLRAIAGLWHAGSGNITCPESVAFLPQRPYLPPGNLQQQLRYPDSYSIIDNSQLNQVLAAVNLEHLALLPTYQETTKKHLSSNEKQKSLSSLSLGEQQRLAFARILLKSPTYVFLDEATSALDLANEASLYGHLQTLGISIISVGHRPSLEKYHDYKLELFAHGEWQYSATSP